MQQKPQWYSTLHGDGQGGSFMAELRENQVASVSYKSSSVELKFEFRSLNCF